MNSDKKECGDATTPRTRLRLVEKLAVGTKVVAPNEDPIPSEVGNKLGLHVKVVRPTRSSTFYDRVE